MIGFRLLLDTTIEPKSSPELGSFLKFFILILAFIFFKILIYFILVSLQITSGIINLAPGVSRASAIKNAAELGSDPTV